ncbi:MAG: hypothetical protein PUI72_00945 [Prevotellaceae bacterium]|nr:hypothetical protein [Prevotellaceae bacterium]MDY6200219.1 hypothetical protein [Prevotella sp.]
MSKNEIATLNASLNKEAEIYRELKKQPDWWQRLLSIKGVYVEIRKDNIVDIYYEGGRMAKLRCKSKRITATCHPKYLGMDVPTGSNPKYVDCLEVLKNNPYFIAKNIQANYSQKEGRNGEDISEKKIQGDMICRRNPLFLDSEFAHRYEIGKRQTIRFDLVMIKNNQLIFIELKRIKDNRLLNKEDDEPEILNQMDKYQKFIKVNKDKLLDYYKTLYEIKSSLKLPVPECEIEKLSVCEVPHLIIINTYKRLGEKRKDRIARMKEILDKASFSYKIEKLITYEMKQQKQQELFRKSITNKGDKYILDDSERDRNLYNWQDKDSVQRVKDYFRVNKIKWWNCSRYAPEGQDGLNITSHLVSSQVACINHLFFIKHDKEAVLSIINGIKDMPVKFKDVMNIPCDKGSDNYIAFEVVASKDYLHEKFLKRGKFCTSVDAFVYALDANNERWLIPIEWKYTETYKRVDKSIGPKGKTRLSRYCNTKGDNLIGNSKQLKSLPDYKHSIYFQEPFYQLMRQTLWAECICNNKEENVLPAEHFVHIHVCPKENEELLDKWYAEVTNKPSMEEAWREMLSDQSLYHLVDPKELLRPIAKSYPELYNYLQERYWQ